MVSSVHRVVTMGFALSLIFFPVVVLNKAIAPSTALAGPLTSPLLTTVLVTVKFGYVPVIVIPVPPVSATIRSGELFVTVKFG